MSIPTRLCFRRQKGYGFTIDAEIPQLSELFKFGHSIHPKLHILASHLTNNPCPRIQIFLPPQTILIISLLLLKKKKNLSLIFMDIFFFANPIYLFHFEA